MTEQPEREGVHAASALTGLARDNETQGNEEQRMTTASVIIKGIEYPVAPLEPELHDHPSPAFPMAVTPHVARNWLTYNYRNRNQRERGMRDYSADMSARDFAINASTISFSRPLGEGEDPEIPAGRVCLMDGQHRLESCIKSNTPFVVYVAYGLDPEVRKTIDSGMKRTFADAVRMRGMKNSTVLAAVTKRVRAWETGDKHLLLKKTTSTHTQLMEFLDEHPEIHRSAEIAVRVQHDFNHTTTRDIRQTMVGLAHWVLMQVDETLAPEFFARLGDGDALKNNHPVRLLRERLMRDQSEKKQGAGATRREIPAVADWQQMCYYIRTWNAYLLWESTPEHRRDELKDFMMVGALDSEKMPTIKTMADVAKEIAKQLAKEQREAA